MSNSIFKVISAENESEFNQISNPQIGEVILVKDTGNMYVCTGSEYIKFASEDSECLQNTTLEEYNPSSLFIHSYNRYNHDRNIQQAK